MSDTRAYIESQIDRFQSELFDFLRIRSISATSEDASEVRRAAEWLAGKIRDAGMDADVLETDKHPVVLGEWRGAGPDVPTVLVYGHYDVQPPEPLDEWDSPPFEPEIREGRIYARGSTDDKGQVYIHVKALETALREGGGGLPVNVVFLFEGEEEIGSPSLVPFVKEHRDRLACDAVVVSDSAMFAPGLPSLVFSLRGLAYFELRIRGPRSDLHSGEYGGSVTNPANALASIVSSLRGDDGRVAVEGFYDRVVEWDDETRAAIARLPFDEDAYREELGVPKLTGEPGYSTLERLWTRPTCDVNGLLSGYTGEGAKTVLPATSMGKVSFRLVPDQDPARIAEIFRKHVRRVAPEGVTVEIEELHGGRPWKAELEGPWFDAAKRALETAFGTAPVLQGEGGSIPIVVEFEEILESPCVLMGFAHPGSNLHAPNEWFPAENFRKGIEAVCDFYQELGAS